MDNRITNSLGGHSLKVNWRSNKKVGEVQELATKMYKDINATEDAEDMNTILGDYYKEASNIMFDFDKAPEDDFWHDDDFPQGEFEYLQQVFMRPTTKI